MSDINFNGYSDEEFFKLFLDAVKETYGEYCTFKEREEDLSGYSEPVFEKSIDEAEQRITSIMKIIPKVTNEAAQHKITADYAKRHLEQCEAALSAEQNKREGVEQQLAKANERIEELEQSNKACAVAIRELIAKGEIGPLLITGNELDEIVNKFAIEQQIKGADYVIETVLPDPRTLTCEMGLLREDMLRAKEQLRKEQE